MQFKRGITFAAPRHSLMLAVRQVIKDLMTYGKHQRVPRSRERYAPLELRRTELDNVILAAHPHVDEVEILREVGKRFEILPDLGHVRSFEWLGPLVVKVLWVEEDGW